MEESYYQGKYNEFIATAKNSEEKWRREIFSRPVLNVFETLSPEYASNVEAVIRIIEEFHEFIIGLASNESD